MYIYKEHFQQQLATMSTSENTQLTSATGYDVSRLRFSAPVPGSIPDSQPAISFKRINISTINEDGTEGELIIRTPKVFSFGVGENKSIDTGKISGWVYPLCLYNRDGPTEEEIQWVKTFEAIVEACKDHLIENKEEIDQFELERANLNKFASCLYWKKEKVKNDKGKFVLKVVEGTGPTLYAKLIYSKKNQKFVTKFYEMQDVTSNVEEGVEVDPLDYLSAYSYAVAAIKIESIFIGNKISLQVKLYEANVQKSQSGMRRLLTARPEADSRVLRQSTKAFSSRPPLDIGDDGGDGDTGSLNGDPPAQDEKSSSTKKTSVRRVVKKITKPSD